MLNAIRYWTCSNGHIVLDHYMPQSGATCNVQGCGTERAKHWIDSNEIYFNVMELLYVAHALEIESWTTMHPQIRALERNIRDLCQAYERER